MSIKKIKKNCRRGILHGNSLNIFWVLFHHCITKDSRLILWDPMHVTSPQCLTSNTLWCWQWFSPLALIYLYLSCPWIVSSTFRVSTSICELLIPKCRVSYTQPTLSLRLSLSLKMFFLVPPRGATETLAWPQIQVLSPLTNLLTYLSSILRERPMMLQAPNSAMWHHLSEHSTFWSLTLLKFKFLKCTLQEIAFVGYVVSTYN